MSSNKSMIKKPRIVIEPQRRNGKERVAAVLEAAAAVIAEKGYESTTMAEIAERSGSPIGSLYRFFPNKKFLAELLILRYVGIIDEWFRKIENQVKVLHIEKISDLMLDLIVDIHGESKAMLSLLEAGEQWEAKGDGIRDSVIKHIIKILKMLAPSLPRTKAKDMAIIILHNMKIMKTLRFKHNISAASGAIEELQDMQRLYLTNKLEIIGKYAQQ